jgi:hypothetical protein
MPWSFLQLRKRCNMCYSVSVQGEILLDNDTRWDILHILKELKYADSAWTRARTKGKRNVNLRSCRPPSIRPMPRLFFNLWTKNLSKTRRRQDIFIMYSIILWIVEGPTQHKQFKLETYYMDAPVNGVMSPTGRTGSSRSACPCRGSAVDPFARSRLISTRCRVWIRHPPVSTPERPEPLNGGRRLPATRPHVRTPWGKQGAGS